MSIKLPLIFNSSDSNNGSFSQTSKSKSSSKFTQKTHSSQTRLSDVNMTNEKPIIYTSWKVGMVFCVAILITLIVCTILASRGTIQIPLNGWEFKALAGATALVGIVQIASIPFFVSFYRQVRERRESAENLSPNDILKNLFGPPTTQCVVTQSPIPTVTSLGSNDGSEEYSSSS